MRKEVYAEVSNELRTVIVTLLTVWQHMDRQVASANPELIETKDCYLDGIQAMSALAAKLTTLAMLDAQPSRTRKRTESGTVESEGLG